MLGDFDFKDIAWPDRLNKSGSLLSQSEGQMLIDAMNDHGLEQLVHFPYPGEKYIGWCIVCTNKNRLIKAILMRTHNIHVPSC